MDCLLAIRKLWNLLQLRGVGIPDKWGTFSVVWKILYFYEAQTRFLDAIRIYGCRARAVFMSSCGFWKTVNVLTTHKSVVSNAWQLLSSWIWYTYLYVFMLSVSLGWPIWSIFVLGVARSTDSYFKRDATGQPVIAFVVCFLLSLCNAFTETVFRSWIWVQTNKADRRFVGRLHLPQTRPMALVRKSEDI